MQWYYYVSYFFGGVFLANSIPHLVHGISGHAFQTPFAKPPGQGHSSSTVNVLWATFNIVIGYLLIFHVGIFDARLPLHIIPAAIGAFIVAIMLARWFGRFNGGNIGT